MSREITLDTLPAYLRGEGYPNAADEIATAGRDSAQLIVALIDAGRNMPEGSEAKLVVSQMARVIGQTHE